MDRYDLVILFLQFGMMTLAGLVGEQLMYRLKQPAVLGELAAGVLIGPTVLGVVAPRYFGWLFPANKAINLCLSDSVWVVPDYGANIGRFRAAECAVDIP